MTRTAFNAGWTFQRVSDFGDIGAHPVRLPHDAMLVEGRDAHAPSGAHGSHFLGGRYLYTKRWSRPEHNNSRFSLLFEGVQGLSRIDVNGTPVGHSVNGYTEFEVDITDAIGEGENLIEVHVDNTGQPNSRWYTGSGIYRHVWLRERGTASFSPDGLQFVTTLRGSAAHVHLAVGVDGDTPSGSEVRVTFWDGERRVADAAAQAHHKHLEVAIDDARLWSADDPHLYRADVQLVTADGVVLDEEHIPIGLRTVTVEAGKGLLINGMRTLLKGACIHHDSGVLGAATFRAAEFRRAQILKENGFNAVRSSHNPLSRDMLDACDQLGLYVMDELTDVWTDKKTNYDGSQFFDQHWRDDVRAMVRKDRNHASVIMYSIGNEIGETATEAGVQLTKEMSDFTGDLDPTRPVTEAINFLVNLMRSFNVSTFDTVAKQEAKAKERAGQPSKAGSTAANNVTNKIGSIMGFVSRLPRADKASRDSFAHVDVSGYNYAASRYKGDAKRHPERLIVGSETMPGDIARNWAKVEQLPNVIGDFMWTGWDYLGEAGLGNWIYGQGQSSMNRPYPHLLAGSGAIDINGVPGAPTLLARAVWGALDRPGIAVRPLDHAGEAVARSAWRSTDAISSWAWRGKTGTTAEIEVYSDAAEVELFLNGRSLGRKRTGPKAGFTARYTTAYEPGELVAVDHVDGVTRRTVLRSATTDLRLALSVDRTVLDANGDDLAFVAIQAVDADGVIEMLSDGEVHVEVTGAGTLAGFGSAIPASTGSFLDSVATLYYGRALAIVRADATAGAVSITATNRHLGASSIDLAVATADRPASHNEAHLTRITDNGV